MPYIRVGITLIDCMKSWKRLPAIVNNVDSILAAALGFYIIQLFSRHGGIGISPDSVTYISAARNFSAGKGLIEFDNVPMVDFPAGYPIFLGIISFVTRMDPVAFGPVLNGFMFACVIYLCGYMMNRFYYPSRWYKIVLLSCFVISPCLLEIYSMMWSETLFILVLLLFIASFKTYLDNEKLSSLLLISMLAGIACVTRYAGVTLVVTGGMLITLNYRMNFMKRIRHLFIFGCVSASLLILNLLRNSASSGTFTGQRQKGITPLLQNIYYFGAVLCDWLPVPKNNNTVQLLVVLGCAALLTTVLLILFLSRTGYHSYEHVSIIFSFVYIGFMLFSATVSRYEQFSSRLLSPLFIPVLWGLSGMLPLWIHKLPRPASRWTAAGLGLVLAAWFQYNQYQQDAETWDGVRDAGIPGYTEDPWPQSPMIAFINKNPGMFKPAYSLYSNAADYLYFYTGLHPYNLPQEVFPGEQKRFYADPRHYIIWFNDIDNPDFINLDEILQNQRFTLLQNFQDGSIYVSVDSSAVKQVQQ